MIHHDDHHVDVTIAVPTLNGEEFLKQLIDGVFAQKTHLKYRLLIIDSGSTDSTLEIVRNHPKVLLHQIPNHEFGHGRTRNLAAKLAKGKYIVFLTQDAIPAHERWLDGMIEPFDLSDKVAAVFGKQIPRPNSPPTIKREVSTVFNSFGSDLALMVYRRNKLVDDLGLAEASGFFSDVNSAVRLDILTKEIPFRDVKYSEDMALGQDVLAAGYQKIYAPLGSVVHSNDYTVREYFKRKFDEAYGLKQATGQSQFVPMKEFIFGTIKSTLMDYKFIVLDKEYSLARKLKGFIIAPAYNVAVRWGYRVGSKDITKEQKEKLSLEGELRKKAE